MVLEVIIENRLKKLKIGDIKDVASLWNIETKANAGKKALAREVSKKMREKERVKALLNSLSNREIEILGIFAVNNWNLEGRELYMWDIMEEELGILHSQDPFFYYSSYHRFRNNAKGLLGSFLIVKTGYGHSPTYVVPKDFREIISEYFSSNPDIKIEIDIKDGDEEIKNRRYEAYKILDDIFLFLTYAAKGIPLTPSLQQIPKRNVEEITKKMKGRSLSGVNLILFVCNILQLVKVKPASLAGKKHFLVTTEKVKDFLMKSREERTLSILHALSNAYYTDIDRFILEELRKLEPNVWYDRSLFLKKVRNALFRKKSRILIDFNKRRLNKILTHLLWFGLIETGIYKNKDVFLLRSAFYGISPEETKEGEGLIVQPNFEIIAFPETPDDILFMLSYFAEVKSADKAKVYGITKNSVLNAIDNGMEAEEIIEFLRDNAKNEIPQNVLYNIKEWSSLYGKVALKKGVFLETDAELMELIKERLIDKDNVMNEISDSLMVIKEEKAISDLIKTEKNVFLEIGDDFSAIEVEKAIGRYVMEKKDERIFVIKEEDLEKCISALKRRDIFPKNFIKEVEK